MHMTHNSNQLQLLLLIKLLYVTVHVGTAQDNLLYTHLLNTILAALDNTIRVKKYIQNRKIIIFSDVDSQTKAPDNKSKQKNGRLPKEMFKSKVRCIRQHSCAFHNGSHTYLEVDAGCCLGVQQILSTRVTDPLQDYSPFNTTFPQDFTNNLRESHYVFTKRLLKTLPASAQHPVLKPTLHVLGLCYNTTPFPVPNSILLLTLSNKLP